MLYPSNLFCKDSASREENKINAFIFSPEAQPIFSKDSASRLCFFFRTIVQTSVMQVHLQITQRV